MRILIAGVNYAPEVTGIAPFTTGLAEHLAQSGHHVTVATTFPFAPQWKWFQPPPAWHAREILNGVEVWRTKVALPKRRTTTGRIIFDSSFGVVGALTALSIPRVDVAICISPPIQAALGLAAIRFKMNRLVILIHDLPIQAAQSVGMLKGRFAIGAGRSLEHLTYKLADHIVVISDSFVSHVKGAGIDHERISEIPNWADLGSFSATPPDPTIRSRLGAGPHDFLVVHAGNMGAKQDLLNVVAAAALLSRERRIKFALIGDGQERDSVEAEISRRYLDNIRLLPLQPSDELGAVLHSADALLINQAPSIVNSVLPSKLLTYMASGRPVVAAAHPTSSTAELITRAACGVVAAPGRPAALGHAIRLMASAKYPPATLAAMASNGRTYVETHFQRGAILQRWDDLLTEIGLQGTGS